MQKQIDDKNICRPNSPSSNVFVAVSVSHSLASSHALKKHPCQPKAAQRMDVRLINEGAIYVHVATNASVYV